MNKQFFLIPFIILMMSGMVLATSMTRTVPSTTVPGSVFSITYIVDGTGGVWGASIVDVVSGGCLFPSGSAEYKSVMLSEDGNTKTVTIIAPNSGGSCMFHGDYKFGTDAVVAFSDATITIEGTPCAPIWSCGSWGVCVDGSQTRTCSDTTVCSADKIESQACSVVCTPVWSCGGWGACVSGTQSRVCSDSNSCGVLTGKPAESQSCGVCEEGSGLTGCIVDQNVGVDCCLRTWHLILAGFILLIIFMGRK